MSLKSTVFVPVVICGGLMGTSATAQPVTDGLTAAFRADALTGLSNGDAVAAWPDSSGAAHDVSQPNTSQQPTYVASALNSQPAVRFNGAQWLFRDNVLGSTLMTTSAATAYLVQKQLASDPQNTTFAWGSGNNRLLMHATWQNILAFQHGDPSGGSWQQPPGWDDQYHIVEFVRDGTTIADCLVDGAGLGRSPSADTPEINETHRLWVGNDIFGNTLTGDVAEILVYNRALTAAERASVVGYLSNKYAIAIRPVATGDVNCDGNVNNFDINAFVAALVGGPNYYDNYPDCNLLNADANLDGAVNNFDIDPFVELLAGG
ncbi:MAG: hypothetical protein JNG88_09505 [Phycisphaerales bacterium]|nr:hypothetical protein [Phycisphaerales bacterium]